MVHNFLGLQNIYVWVDSRNEGRGTFASTANVANHPANYYNDDGSNTIK